MGLDVVFLVALLVMVGSIISAVVGMGGGILLIGATSLLLPVNVLIPLNSTFMFASLLSRAVQFRSYIDKSIVLPFCVGSFLGAVGGALLYSSLPQSIIQLGLGVLLLFITWLPKSKPDKESRFKGTKGYFVLGCVHTFLSNLMGVSGLYQAVLSRMRLEKKVFIGTISGGLLAMATLKIIGFTLVGFDYLAYVDLIAAAVVACVIGTWIGKRIIEYVSEFVFQKLLQALVTILALRMLYQGISAIM